MAVEQLGVPPLTDQQYELMGFDGSKSFAPVVMLDMLFLRRAFPRPVSVDRGRAWHFRARYSQPSDGAVAWSAAAMVRTYTITWWEQDSP
jgi:hypothetical protein